VLRVEVSEEGQDPLPAVDLDDSIVVIGSAADARVRLPAAVAEAEHVVIERGRWRANGRVVVDGTPVREGAIGNGVTLGIGAYRMRVQPSPPGAVAVPPQRTESLARELMRSLLGAGAAPSLEVERGPTVGDKRLLAAPESTLVVGRGDEAGWILLDEDLSRAHAEIRRGWDGTRIVDLGSKNGTKLDGAAVGADGAVLHDGALVELGKVAIRFRDPAEQQLRATPQTQAATPRSLRPAPPVAPVAAASPAGPTRGTAPPSRAPFYLAIFVMVTALTGLVWILALA
jgi:hypothetical protein